MKKACFLLSLVIVASACTKKYNTTNNYYTLPANAQPAFLVEGINNITLINDFETSASLQISVQYEDSVQEDLTLSLTGLPPGVLIDTTWVSHGIPTFSTSLTLYDSSSAGAVPGSYLVTLTATTVSGEEKHYPFTLKILPMPINFLGKYALCTSSCATGTYSDSLYADPTIANKIWFANFANSGNTVYGFVSVSPLNAIITVPAQTAGGITYSGTSSDNIILSQHQEFSMDIHVGATTCTLNME